MNPLTITPAQPTVVAPSDSSSAAAGSESDFGPILQAAAIPPAPSPGQKGTASNSRTQQQAGKDDTVTTADPASAKADRTAARRSSRDSAGTAQRTEADAAAAASAVAGIVPPRVDAAPAAEASAASRSAAGNSSDVASDQTHRGSAVAKASTATASDPSPAGPAPIQAPIIGAEALALRTPIGSAAAAQPSTQPSKLAGDAIQSDPAGAVPARTSIRSEDVRSDDGGDHDSEDDGGADAQPDSAFTAALAPESALSSGSAAQAVAHALSVQIQQATSQTADSAPAPANNAPALITPTDVASTAAASATGAFGTAASYPPDSRASVATPVGQPGFGQEFSERVIVLARGGVQTAQISLEPAGLGPVGVSIQVHGHAASLVFTAQHETTRNALEAELPRLREMFAANGMQLSDASVGGRAQSQWSAPDQAPSSSQPPADGAADPPAGAAAEAVTTVRAQAVQRLVDTYA